MQDMTTSALFGSVKLYIEIVASFVSSSWYLSESMCSANTYEETTLFFVSKIIIINIKHQKVTIPYSVTFWTVMVNLTVDVTLGLEVVAPPLLVVREVLVVVVVGELAPNVGDILKIGEVLFTTTITSASSIECQEN